MPKEKEKRDAILYAKVTPTNKKFIQDRYKKMGYSTLSEYVDEVLTDQRSTIKWKKGKK